MAEKTTETQQPAKSGFWKRAGRIFLLTLGAVGAAMGVVALDKKTGIITKLTDATVSTGKKACGAVKDKFSKKTETVQEPVDVEVVKETSQNNNYQRNNWQRDDRRPDNRRYN